MDVKISKIIITIGGKEIELTYEQLIELKNKLNQLFSNQDIWSPPVNPYPAPYTPPVTPWNPLTPLVAPYNPWETITWCKFTSSEGVLKIDV